MFRSPILPPLISIVWPLFGPPLSDVVARPKNLEIMLANGVAISTSPEAVYLAPSVFVDLSVANDSHQNPPPFFFTLSSNSQFA